jgi:toxin ParE1/3/4
VEIHDYIAQDSPLYAKQVSENLVRKTLTLNELPRIGKAVPELRNESVRELALYSYRILYEIKPTHIEVLAVIHEGNAAPPEAAQRMRRTNGLQHPIAQCERGALACCFIFLASHVTCG